MRNFLITVGIGFSLLALLFLRIIMIDPQDKKSSELSGPQDVQKIEKKKESPEKEIHVLKTYYDNSEVSSEWPFIDGKLNGSVKQYYPNGKFLSEVDYVNNAKSGLSRTYYENHSLWSEFNFENGLEEGVAKEYYPSGALWAEWIYQNGLVQDVKLFFESVEGKDKRTESESEVFYSNGVKSGAFAVQENQEGKEVSLFYSNGNLYKKVRFGSKESADLITIYYAEGDDAIWRTSESLNFSREYYPNGALWIQSLQSEYGAKKLPIAYSQGGKIFQETRVTIDSD